MGPGNALDVGEHGLDLSTVLSMARVGLLEANPESCVGWTDDMLIENEVKVFVYTRAKFRGQEVVTGRLYAQERARDSSHMTAVYVDDEGVSKQHVASIQFFVRITSSTQPEVLPLRFPVAHFYDYVAPVVDDDLGVVHKAHVPQLETGRFGIYHPVPFSSLQSKLVYCTVRGTRYSVPYNISTGLY